MGKKRDLLEGRAAAAITLRQFDSEARRMGITRMAGRIARERKYIVEALKAHGGQSWNYSSTADNSWIPG